MYSLLNVRPCIARTSCAIPGFHLENLFRGSGSEKTTVLLPLPMHPSHFRGGVSYTYGGYKHT